MVATRMGTRTAAATRIQSWSRMVVIQSWFRKLKIHHLTVVPRLVKCQAWFRMQLVKLHRLKAAQFYLTMVARLVQCQAWSRMQLVNLHRSKAAEFEPHRFKAAGPENSPDTSSLCYPPVAPDTLAEPAAPVEPDPVPGEQPGISDLVLVELPPCRDSLQVHSTAFIAPARRVTAPNPHCEGRSVSTMEAITLKERALSLRNKWPMQFEDPRAVFVLDSALPRVKQVLLPPPPLRESTPPPSHGGSPRTFKVHNTASTAPARGGTALDSYCEGGSAFTMEAVTLREMTLSLCDKWLMQFEDLCGTLEQAAFISPSTPGTDKAAKTADLQDFILIQKTSCVFSCRFSGLGPLTPGEDIEMPASLSVYWTSANCET